MGRRSREVAEQRASRTRDAEACRQAAHERRAAAIRGAEEGRERGCLFCRRSDGGFTSQEHIVPESLGNVEKVLPVGVVCDRCNSGVLSQVDAALCDFGPFAMMKTIYGIPSKAGKMPEVKFDNGRLYARSPGDLVVQLAPKWRKDILAPPGQVGFQFTLQRHDATPRRLSKVHRALVKQAVELAWLDMEPDRLLSAEFDRERHIVLYGGHHGYLILPNDATPVPNNITLHYAPFVRNGDAQPFLFIVASYWGVHIATDTLQAEPQGAVPEDFAVVHRF